MEHSSGNQSNLQRNLRLECARFGTIAEFCRAAGMNRQQFNKYLAGTSMPSMRSLKRICDVLGTMPQALMGERRALGSDTKLRQGDAQVLAFRKLVHLSGEVQFDCASISPGLHYCFMRLPSNTDLLIKGLLAVWDKGSHLGFVRLTIVPGEGDLSRPLVAGRHSGIICESSTEIFLLGANRYRPFQISLMTLDKTSAASTGFYAGILLTHVARSQGCAKVHIQPVGPNVSVREAIKSLGIANVSELDPRTQLLSGLAG